MKTVYNYHAMIILHILYLCYIKIQMSMATRASLAVCYCGNHTREITCGSDGVYSLNYSCQNSCGKPLVCGNHSCEQLCHDGPCNPCKTAPEMVTTCNCGKVSLVLLKDNPPRTSCTDSIPSCGQVCGKVIDCGEKRIRFCLNF